MKKLVISIFMLCAFANSLAENLASNQYPDLQGKIVKEIKYTDKTGDNVIVLTKTDIITQKCEYSDECQNQDMFVYRYLKTNGQMQKKWQIHDFVHNCDLGGFGVEPLLDFIKISDENHNQIKEVWIPYQLRCSGDPGPEVSKIIAYEDTQKYAQRGAFREWVGCGDNGKPTLDGGEYSMDENLKQSAPLKKFAESLWKQINAKFAKQAEGICKAQTSQ